MITPRRPFDSTRSKSKGREAVRSSHATLETCVPCVCRPADCRNVTVKGDGWIQRIAFFFPGVRETFARAKGWVRTAGLVAGARKDPRVRPFPAAEWRPRGSRGTECGPEKCSSTNQVNGAQIHPILSFLLPSLFSYSSRSLFSSLLFYIFSQLFTTSRGGEGMKKLEDNYATRYAEWVLLDGSRARWRRFDERRVIAHPCMGGTLLLLLNRFTRCSPNAVQSIFGGRGSAFREPFYARHGICLKRFVLHIIVIIIRRLIFDNFENLWCYEFKKSRKCILISSVLLEGFVRKCSSNNFWRFDC